MGFGPIDGGSNPPGPIMFKEELLQDIKALGGFPLYAIAIVVSFFFGWVELSAQLLVGIILAFGVTVGIRMVSFKRRPDGQPYRNFLGKIDAASFPSLHSMRSSVLAALLAIHFGNLALTVLLVLYAVAVAASRVLLKRHYIADVVAGLILGVLVALASVWLVARFIS